MALISKTSLLRLAYPVAVLALAALTPGQARADAFDDMRRTFQTDIPHFFQTDVPHFFQDDIPCAFGGQPTSGTKKSCKSPPAQKAKPATKQKAAPDAAPDPDGNATIMSAPHDAPIEQKQLPPPAGGSN